MPIDIEPARAEDVARVKELLRERRLPLDGLDDHVDTLLVARDDASVVGSVALELYDGGALLRSLAVAPAVQRQGVGRLLTESIVRLARERGIRDLFLLTTTASDYFPRFGFERVSREDVPESVRESIEFKSACPASAIAMRARLP
jgi:N-acetylglutamate synthase-like GNAT family acetyltransferase